MPVKFRDTIKINDSYTLPSADGSSGQAITTDGSGALSFSTISGSNTTYTVNSVTSGDNAIIRLTGSDSSTDDVTIAAGSNITISETGDTITIASTDTNTQTESFKTISVSGQSDVVADSSTDTLTLAAGDNITLTTNAGTDTITVAAASGSTQLVTQKNTFTGNGSTTAFSLSSTIADEARTQVYMDGVYQNKDTYSTSGSTITFSTAPPNSTAVEVIHFTSLSGGISKVDTYTGNGSTTAFVTSISITDENNTQIYINGVYQSKSVYSTSGSTVTFNSAPANSTTIEIVHFKELALSGMTNDTFTGDGSATAFTLGAEVTDENNTWVFMNGVYQDKSVYSISGAILTFTTAPQSGYGIEVMKLGTVTAASNALVTNTFTGNGSTTAYALGVTPASLHALNAYISGLRQDNSTLSLSGNTLTFSTAPPSGASIEIRSIGGVVPSTIVSPSSVTAGTGISVSNPSTGNFVVTNTGLDYNVSVITSATTAVKNTLYVFTASAALTLPAGVVGNSIKISNRSGTTTCTIVPNGTDKIMGSNTTYTINVATASFELIFSGTAQGWVIIGQ